MPCGYMGGRVGGRCVEYLSFPGDSRNYIKCQLFALQQNYGVHTRAAAGRVRINSTAPAPAQQAPRAEPPPQPFPPPASDSSRAPPRRDTTAVDARSPPGPSSRAPARRPPPSSPPNLRLAAPARRHAPAPPPRRRRRGARPGVVGRGYATSTSTSAAASSSLVRVTNLPAPSSGHVRVLELDRPEARNALSSALLARLAAEVRAVTGQYADDGRVELPAAAPAGLGPTRALVLASAVDACFCAGADLKERRSFTPSQSVALASRPVP